MYRIFGHAVTSKDMAQRYVGTYIKFLHPGTRESVVDYCVDVSDRTISFENHRIDHDQFQMITDFPEMGAVDIDGIVHHVLRNPARQWSRGLSAKVIDDFCREPRVYRLNQALQIKEAKALFDRKFTPMREGVERIKKGQINSFCHNTQYWVKGTPKEMYLWRDRIPVGQIAGNMVMFFPECSVLKQEVKDDLRGIYEIR